MQTVFDWLSVLLFAALVVLYLQRSSRATPVDRIWQYIPPAIGCAAANYLGNHGSPLAAVVLMVLVMAYVFYALLRPRPQS
ncbi:XrtV sorting system accessory protein [Novosphingobium huizhouense]|uniref:XrtV sorting system accessory protein n=1 Tax=Novosphingobium huizhouense TaxID=2866625 RepID=UPI001CD85CE5|nr:XrtV sorting system accessory protein [Novosphingobium huizhouense]